MADEQKIASLSVDASSAVDGIQQIGDAAQATGEKLASATVQVEKTETQVKKLASSSRDYNAAARAVGDSTQNITKFSQAYSAALKDVSNSEETRARIIQQVAARTIGANLDEAKALELLRAKHTDVTTVARQMAGTSNSTTFGIANTGKASRTSAYQLQNLSYQLNDVVSGFAMGQRPMQIFAQQGGQIFQILSGMNSPLKLLAGPVGLIAGAVAAVGALGMAMWTSKASVDAVNTALRSSSNVVGLSGSAMETFARDLASTSKISVSAAEDIQNALAKAGTTSGKNFMDLRVQTALVAKALKQDGATAAETLGKAMADPAKAAKELNGQYWSLTAAQIRHVSELQAAGEMEKAQAVLISAMSEKIGEARIKTRNWQVVVRGLSDAWRSFSNWASGGIQTIDKLTEAQKKLSEAQSHAGDVRFIGNDEQITYWKAEVDRRQAQLDAEREKAAAKGTISSRQPAINVGLSSADKALPSYDDLKSLTQEAGRLETALKAAIATNDNSPQAVANIDKLGASLRAVRAATSSYVTEGERAVLISQAQAKASTMTSAEGAKYLALETQRINSLGKVVSAQERERQSVAASTAANTAYNKAMIEQGKALSEGQIASRATLAQTALDQERQILAQRRAIGEISAVDELAQAISINDRKRAVDENAAAQRLALLRRTAGTERTEIAAAERALTELRAKGAADRQKELDAEVAARRAQTKKMAEIAASQVAAESNIGVAGKVEALSQGKAMGDIKYASEIASREREIANERYQIELDLLNKKLALANQEPVERQNILNQIKSLEKQHSLDIQKIDNQATQNRLASIRSWTEPFKSAVNTMVSSYISGTQTMRQITLNFANYIASSYIGKFADIAMAWFEKHVLMAAWDKLFASKEVATESTKQAMKSAAVVAGEGERTAATATGTAARTAIGATEDSSFFGRLGRLIAEWFGLETAKTTGTAVGVATREAEEDSATIASIAAAKAQAVAEIPSYAGIGASAAMASVAAIPFVGWAMAPAVGAEHAALAMSYLALASAEDGWGEVPSNGVLTELHKHEMVLPASLAVPLRSALTKGNMAAQIPAFGLPSFITNRSNFATNTTNRSVSSTTNRGGDIHINGLAVSKGMTDRELMEKGAVFAKAFKAELVKGNPDARYVAGRRS